MEERNTLLNEMAAIDGKPVNPGTMINTSVANVICSLLYGEGYDHDDKDFQELIEAVDNTVGDALSNSELDFIPIKQFFPGYRASLNKWKQSVNKLHEYLEKQIAIRRERRKKSNEEVPGDFVESYLKELDAADGRITQDWLEDITLDLFIAGTETTTTTLKWSLLYLVLSPDVQKKVQEELDAVLGQPTGSGVSKLSDRADLPYTEATIMEIQRMSAIVATALVHCTTTDVEFRGWKLPKNTQVRVPHRSGPHTDQGPTQVRVPHMSGSHTGQGPTQVRAPHRSGSHTGQGPTQVRAPHRPGPHTGQGPTRVRAPHRPGPHTCQGPTQVRVPHR